jgi:hypothetical protein
VSARFRCGAVPPGPAEHLIRFWTADLADHVPPAARARLTAALVPRFGADAVVWTRDVADLSPPTRWTCSFGWPGYLSRRPSPSRSRPQTAEPTRETAPPAERPSADGATRRSCLDGQMRSSSLSCRGASAVSPWPPATGPGPGRKE